MTNSFRRMRNGGDRSYDTIKNAGWVERAVMGSHSVGGVGQRKQAGCSKVLGGVYPGRQGLCEE